MKTAICIIAMLCVSAQAADLKSGPPLPHRLVRDWAQLPKGLNFGECSGVDVDKNDHVWVFNRGAHPIIELDKSGKMLQAWDENTIRVKSAHRSEERRVGKECTSWCRSRWSPYH